jgi:hypothetical protein
VFGCYITTTYSSHKGDDAFLLGRSRTAKRNKLDLRSFSETLLRVIDALGQYGEMERKRLSKDRGVPVDDLDQCGEMDRKQLSWVTGKTLSSIGTATRRGKKLAILFESQDYKNGPKKYMLSPWAWEVIEKLAPQMKTHKLRIERQDRDLEQTQRRCEDTIRLADAGEFHLGRVSRLRLEELREWAIKKRRKHVARIYPDWTEEGITRWIEAPAPTNLHDPVIRALVEGRTSLARERTERGRKEGRKEYERALRVLLSQAEDDMRQLRIPIAEWAYYLSYLGYAPRDVKEIVSSARSKRGSLRPAVESQKEGKINEYTQPELRVATINST